MGTDDDEDKTQAIDEPYFKAYMDKTDDTVDRVYCLKIDNSGAKSIGDARVEFYDNGTIFEQKR